MNPCDVCPKKYRPISGDGLTSSRVMLVGERPGKDELQSGIPFVGQSGRELNENYLQLAGLRREDVYVTNAVKCFADQNKKPGVKEVEGCAGFHLSRELDEVSPEVLILLGATACSLVPEIDLEVEHGIPSKRRLYTSNRRLYNWEGMVVPMFHPAAGLHQTEMMIPMLEDWSRLARWLEDGTWVWAVDDVKRKYQLATSKQTIRSYFMASDPQLIGVDTESHCEVPYSIQVSCKVGTGLMVLMRDEELVRDLAGWLNVAMGFGEAKLVFHHAEADIKLVEQVTGFSLKGNYRDTMQECYQFQNNYRQALKALSRRHLGRVRKSWDEVVTPHSKVVLQDWLMSAWGYAESSWTETILQVSKTTGKAIKSKVVVSKVASALKSIYFHTLDGDEYDGWAKVRERVGEVELMMLEAAEGVGSMPGKGIAYVPIAEAVEYGCSDADDTLALAILFDRMRRELVSELNVQPEDIDA